MFKALHRAMSHAQTLASIRLKAVAALRQFRLSDGPEPREAILLRKGIYCGRRFLAERGYAVWNAETDELTVFHAEGKLLTTLPQASNPQVSTRAAA